MERNSNYKVMLRLILLKISSCRIPKTSNCETAQVRILSPGT